jgi:hypothetical protein
MQSLFSPARGVLLCALFSYITMQLLFSPAQGGVPEGRRGSITLLGKYLLSLL